MIRWSEKVTNEQVLEPRHHHQLFCINVDESCVFYSYSGIRTWLRSIDFFQVLRTRESEVSGAH